MEQLMVLLKPTARHNVLLVSFMPLGERCRFLAALEWLGKRFGRSYVDCSARLLCFVLSLCPRGDHFSGLAITVSHVEVLCGEGLVAINLTLAFVSACACLLLAFHAMKRKLIYHEIKLLNTTPIYQMYLVTPQAVGPPNNLGTGPFGSPQYSTALTPSTSTGR